MLIETPESTSLVQGWTFRILLLVAALTGFLGVAVNTTHRLQVSTFGIPATIELASKSSTLPNDWSDYEGRSRAMFFVKIKPDNGNELSSELYLPKEIVETLLRGETKRIVFADENPRKFIIEGEPLPPFGVGWLIFGFVSSGLFVYSLRLR